MCPLPLNRWPRRATRSGTPTWSSPYWPDGAALGTVLFGPHGAARAMRPGTVVCDLGTIGVAAAQAHAAELAGGGVSFVDAPVSGSVPSVRSRSLLVMAGGVAERGGVAREMALEVLAGSAVAAPYVLYKRAAFADPDGQPVAFTVDLMRKDLDLILRFAESRSSPMPLAEVVSGVSDRASAAGLGTKDMSTIAELHREH